MIEITGRQAISNEALLLEIAHPRLAGALHPGQFAMVLPEAEGVRIPAAVADYDRRRGSVTLALKAHSDATRALLAAAQPGTTWHAVLGPMGRSASCHDHATLIGLGQGLGAAPLYPRLRDWKASGARVIGVLGFADASEAFWTERFAAICDVLVVTTEDGSRGEPGHVVDALVHALTRHPDVTEVLASSSLETLHACVDPTRAAGVRLTVTVGPLLAAGVGGCGACGLIVAGRKHFTCVDGPDFDGHAVDFAALRACLGSESTPASHAHASSPHEDCRLLDGHHG